MSTGANDPDSPVSTVDENEHGVPATDVKTEGEEAAEAAPSKLELDVQISDVGPCKKHVKLTIARAEIDRQFNESLGTMKKEALVPGFRPGHAPRMLVEKRFRKQVSDQVKSTLMVAALEQLDKDYQLNAISEPKLDIAAISLPEEGPFEFEIELEVRPEFSLPVYKGLRVNRPVRAISEADVDAQLTLFRERHAPIVPKLEGAAEIGDFITVDLRFHLDGQTISEVKETQFRLLPELRFQDGSVPKLGEVLVGIKPGESREADAKIGSAAANPFLRGQTVRLTFHVHDLKQYRLPEVDATFLENLGFESSDQLRAALRDLLERRLQSQQRQAMRQEILDKLIGEVPFDLPSELVSRQEQTTVRRLVMEMQQGGLSETEIRARSAEIRANAAESTQRSLKELFILAKIAEAEGIKVEDEDIDLEIETIAARDNESPRRVRSRIKKEGLSDTLAAQILERKALDLILEHAVYQEVALVADDVAVETLDQTATTAPPSEETAEGEGASAQAATTEGASSQAATEEEGSAG